MKTKLTLLFFTVFIYQFSTAQKQIEITYERKSDKSIEFRYKKNVPGTYYLEMTFPLLENCSSKDVHRIIIKHKTGILLTLSPSNPDKGIGFSYKSTYIMGNPNPRINEEISYLLPFKTGKEINLFEASNLGEKYFGSGKPINWKSFVAIMKEPDTVYAMRKGIVVSIENKYELDTTFSTTYTSKRNSLMVEHEDGTYASYTGFMQDSFLVKPGQEIYPHTPLGQLEQFDEQLFRLDFYVFHFLDNILEKQKVSTLKNRSFNTKFLDPVFYVDDEFIHLESGNSYKVSYNEEIKLQEFSRREKKKYKKNPAEFK